jgi:hypothetical protein
MKSSLLAAALSVVTGLGAVAPAVARGVGDPPATTTSAAKTVDPPKKDEKTTDYERAVKDLKRIDGPFPIYLRRKEILLEVPEDALGKLFLIQATLATGANAMGLQAGDPLNGIDVYSWEKTEENLTLVEPNLKYRWSKDDPLAVSSARSFPKAYLGSYRIEQTNTEKHVMLVNVTSLFTGELLRLNELVSVMLGGAYQLDRDKTGVEKAKGYGDENTVLQMKMHYYSPRGAAEANPLLALLGIGKTALEDDRSVPLKVTYNMWYRKDDGYRPRLSDPRIGYFTTDYFSLDKFLGDDQTQRLINRFNLKKKDPSAAMSEPVKPIVWVVDPSVPKKWRGAVRDGILRWNKAFEELGYKNAVQVKEVDNDPDYDHSDGRYNVVRWTISEDAGYAVAQARSDPISGETMNAAVTFDSTMLSFILGEHRNYSTPVATSLVKHSYEALTDSDETRNVAPDAYIFDHDRVVAEKEADKLFKRFGWRRLECELPNELAADASFMYAALQAAPGLKVAPDDYAKAYIEDVVSHEVGHCLGLRHNFIGSTNLTTAQLADDALIDKVGVSASVMDYVPTNVQAVLKGKGNFFTPVVGPYDVWAIKYGYMDVPMANDPVSETYALSRVASQSGLPGHAYLTDEDADSYDPYAVRFDNAKDPVNYFGQEMKAAKRALHYALTNLPRPGESYTRRTELVAASLLRTFKCGRNASRFVGGIGVSRNFRGDTDERATLQPVSATEQRQAIGLITHSCLVEDAFTLPTEARVRLTLGNVENTWDAPLRSVVSSQQIALVGTLLSAEKTSRIAENAYKLSSGAGSYSLGEHYGTILAAVFSEVGQSKNIEANRRDLQRFTVNALITQSSAPPSGVNEDVRMIATDSLRRLSTRFGSQIANGKKLDDMTRLYLRDTKAIIDRFLARTVTGAR